MKYKRPHTMPIERVGVLDFDDFGEEYKKVVLNREFKKDFAEIDWFYREVMKTHWALQGRSGIGPNAWRLASPYWYDTEFDDKSDNNDPYDNQEIS